MNILFPFYSCLQTVEEIEGALGRDFYPSLCEERVRWEKELAGLREENESLTAMLCSKEEDLNRTKATMNAIREERDRLRRRVSDTIETQDKQFRLITTDSSCRVRFKH